MHSKYQRSEARNQRQKCDKSRGIESGEDGDEPIHGDFQSFISNHLDFKSADVYPSRKIWPSVNPDLLLTESANINTTSLVSVISLKSALVFGMLNRHGELLISEEGSITENV